MHTPAQAVVLRYTCKATPLISLYCPTHGRLVVYDRRRHHTKQPLAPGQLIDCAIERFGNSWQLQMAEPVMVKATSSSYESLYWQHHLLDIYYCYIPLEQPSDELFRLLTVFMRLDAAPAKVWKAAIVYLFSLLGYGVPKSLLECIKLIVLIDEHARTYNTANVLHIDWQKQYVWSEQAIDDWLVQMLEQHDHYHLLKTQYLLSQLYGTAKR